MPSFTITSNVAGAVCCTCSLLFAFFFLERYLKLEPCPLCILDRIVVALMGVVFLAGLMVGAARVRLWLAVANIAIASVGLLLAARHVWLQNQPLNDEQVCLPGSETANSLAEIVGKAFGAGGDCQLIMWDLAGLGIPMQVLILFAALAVLVLAQIYSICRQLIIGENYQR